MEASTNLRQAKTNVVAVGILTEKNLKSEIDPKFGETIKGKVTVKTDDTNFITFSISCREKTGKNEHNNVFDGIKTVMEEYKAVADVGADEADRVRVVGQLNPYLGPNGQEYMGYRGSFFTRINGRKDEFTPEATFSTEMYIERLVPEMTKEGEETGRLKIKGWLPTYNGIEPIELIVDADNAAAVEATYEPKQTTEFSGDIVNNRIVTEIEKPGAFGKPKKEVKTKFINELVVTWGDMVYDAEEGEKAPYNPETIQKAIEERNAELQSKKAEGKKSGGGFNSKPSGASRGRKMPQGW